MLVELCLVEQRLQAVKDVLEGASVTDVARRNGVARQTVHEWLRHYADDGISGLVARSSRPGSCPHQMAPAIEAQILELRRKHPGWGPRTIGYQLAKKGIEPLPGRSSIHRCLVRHGLVTPEKRKRKRSDYKSWERSASMELWQMDVVGRLHLADGTELSAITGIDDHSRFCISAQLVARAMARPVCDALVLALRRHGIPASILTDNGKVFTARFGPGPGPVLFDKICLDNGIHHLLTAPYSPTTTGKVERFHKTLRSEFLSEHDRRHETIEQFQAALDRWVQDYNTTRPHQSIGGHPPIERFRLARASALEPIEEAPVTPEPVFDPAAITRRVDERGQIHLEGFSYRAGRLICGEVVEVRFHEGLLDVVHRGVTVATHARRVRELRTKVQSNEPRVRVVRARPASVGSRVTRLVDSSGSVSFSGWAYRVGNGYKGRSVEVAIVAGAVEFSLNGEVIKHHPIRHDRQKEFGAFARPRGKLTGPP